MRILVLSDLYPPVVRGGYEIECHDVVEHLRGRHDVTVLTSARGHRHQAREAHVLRSLPWVGDERRIDALRAPLSAVRAARVVRRVLAGTRPDLVYVWNASGVPATALATLQRSGVPLIIRACEAWITRYPADDLFVRTLGDGPGGGRRLWSLAMRTVDRLPGLRLGPPPGSPTPAAICWNSEFLRRTAPASERFTVVHGATVIPATERLTRVAQLERAPSRSRILFVGRLEEAKGAAVLVRALGILHRRGIRADVVLVGGGTKDDRLRLGRLAEQEGVAADVRLTGPLRGADLEAEIVAAAVWSVPSTWDEPAGLTSTEAALARVPAVLSNVGGIPELYQPGLHALFHEPGDAEGCANALAEVLRGGAEVRARTARAFDRGLELSWEPYLAAMDAFLREGTEACVTALSRPSP